MNIRSKLTLSFATTVIIPLLIIAAISITMTISRSSADFIERTQAELRQVDNGFQLFFQQVKNNVVYLANNQFTQNLPENTHNYVGASHMMSPEDDSVAENNLYNFYNNFGQSHTDLVYIYTGTKQGGFVQYPLEALGKYDPRQRPWYKQALASPNKAIVTEAYQDVVGLPVITAAITIKNNLNELLGVQGVDVSLATLTNILSNTKLGDSGYMILIDEFGTVLADPKTPDNNFKNIKELSSPLFKSLYKQSDQENFQTTHLNKDINVATYFSKSLKWRFVGVIDSDEILAPAYKMSTTIIIIALIMVTVFIGLGIWLANRIVQPINHVAMGLQDIAKGEGNLSKRLEVIGKDEISELALWFNQFLDSIHRLVVDIKTCAVTLNDTANHSSVQISNIKTSSYQQESSLENASEQIEHMTETAHQVSDECQECTTTIQNTEEFSLKGNKLISITVEEVSTLNQSLSDSFRSVQSLEQESENITKILDVIRSIAEQTNLLALNAAIEAARAGEQGRGFAVVADEVRSLAQRSRGATEEIDTVLMNLLSQTRVVAEKMASSAEHSTEVINKIEQASHSFKDINKSVIQMKGHINRITSATEQQCDSSDMINKGVSDINQSAKGITTHADTLSEGSSDLLKLSKDLTDLVGRFSVSD